MVATPGTADGTAAAGWPGRRRPRGIGQQQPSGQHDPSQQDVVTVVTSSHNRSQGRARQAAGLTRVRRRQPVVWPGRCRGQPLSAGSAERTSSAAAWSATIGPPVSPSTSTMPSRSSSTAACGTRWSHGTGRSPPAGCRPPYRMAQASRAHAPGRQYIDGCRCTRCCQSHRCLSIYRWGCSVPPGLLH